jgi:hypothetical protein
MKIKEIIEEAIGEDIFEDNPAGSLYGDGRNHEKQELKAKIPEIEKRIIEEIQKNLPVGFLRQHINEDLGVKRLVDDEEIRQFINIGLKNLTE